MELPTLSDLAPPEEHVADGAPRRRPGRPRDTGARDVILAATMELLAEVGFAAITVDGVAQRAGVGKATIYRRWASKERLVSDAVSTTAPPTPLPSTGSLVGDLRQLYGTMAGQVSEPESRSLLASMLAQATVDDEMNAKLTQMVNQRKEVSRTVLREAIRRGELRADTDVDVVIDLLSGAVMYRACFEGASVEEDRVATIVDTVLHGLQTRP